MRYFLIILFLSVTFSSIILGKNNQGSSSGWAKIKFIDNKDIHSRTYLGKLTKGDLQSLKFELQNNFTGSQSNETDLKNSEFNGYVDRVTAKNLKKKWKNNPKRAKNDLLGNYKVEDEKSLKKVKEKKLKDKKEKASNIANAGNKKKYSESTSTKRPKSYISKYYRIKGKRIRNGQTIKKHAGFVCLIVEYKIREGNYVNSYVDIVEDYLKEGSKYNLKYHGNGSKRKYYLEFVSAPLN